MKPTGGHRRVLPLPLRPLLVIVSGGLRPWQELQFILNNWPFLLASDLHSALFSPLPTPDLGSSLPLLPSSSEELRTLVLTMPSPYHNVHLVLPLGGGAAAVLAGKAPCFFSLGSAGGDQAVGLVDAWREDDTAIDSGAAITRWRHEVLSTGSMAMAFKTSTFRHCKPGTRSWRTTPSKDSAISTKLQHKKHMLNASDGLVVNLGLLGSWFGKVFGLACWMQNLRNHSWRKRFRERFRLKVRYCSVQIQTWGIDDFFFGSKLRTTDRAARLSVFIRLDSLSLRFIGVQSIQDESGVAYTKSTTCPSSVLDAQSEVINGGVAGETSIGKHCKDPYDNPIAVLRPCLVKLQAPMGSSAGIFFLLCLICAFAGTQPIFHFSWEAAFVIFRISMRTMYSVPK